MNYRHDVGSTTKATALKQAAFTIVELLIVIVVIGILAAISIVAYSGIQNRANDTTVQSDLRNFGMKVEEYRAIEGDYPAGNAGNGIVGIDKIKISKSSYDVTSGNNNLYYCAGVDSAGSPRVGIVAASTSGNVYEYTTGGGVRPHSGAWVNSHATFCARLGLATGHTYSLGRNHSAGEWRDWIE